MIHWEVTWNEFSSYCSPNTLWLVTGNVPAYFISSQKHSFPRISLNKNFDKKIFRIVVITSNFKNHAWNCSLQFSSLLMNIFCVVLQECPDLKCPVLSVCCDGGCRGIRNTSMFLYKDYICIWIDTVNRGSEIHQIYYMKYPDFVTYRQI